MRSLTKVKGLDSKPKVGTQIVFSIHPIDNPCTGTMDPPKVACNPNFQFEVQSKAS